MYLLTNPRMIGAQKDIILVRNECEHWSLLSTISARVVQLEFGVDAVSVQLGSAM